MVVERIAIHKYRQGRTIFVITNKGMGNKLEQIRNSPLANFTKASNKKLNRNLHTNDMIHAQP